MDDADPWMSEVADRESLRARRPSPDLTSVRGCLHRLSSSTDGGVDAGSRAAGAGMRRLRTSGDSSCTGGGGIRGQGERGRGRAAPPAMQEDAGSRVVAAGLGFVRTEGMRRRCRIFNLFSDVKL